jgi:hypothetical protein
MKIYFTAAISLKDIYGENYKLIVNRLEKLGHKVIHSQITGLSLQDVLNTTDEQRVIYYKKVVKWISECDLLVAEVSFPSTLNVGHEVSLALEKGKSVIALYVEGKSSPLFAGIKSDRLLYEKYTPENINETLGESLEYIQENGDTRFNFIVPRKILEYLDWIAIHKHLPRSVYLRNLIEQDMKKNKDFK